MKLAAAFVRPWGVFVLFSGLVPLAHSQPGGTALVRHAAQLNGTVEGSVHQMLAESATLNGGAAVAGDLLVPGTPEVRLNGKPNYGGTIDGGGATTPSSHKITLNGNATLRHTVRRTNPIALPATATLPVSTGSRLVLLFFEGQSAGDFATIRYLTLGEKIGAVAVPPGNT